MRTSASIEVIVHYPQNEADGKELARRAAELHAEFVLAAIEKQNCPLHQKQKLLQAVIDEARENAAV